MAAFVSRFGPADMKQIGVHFGAVDMTHEMCGIRAAETAADSSHFGRIGTLLETIGIDLSFGVAETSHFGSNFSSPETCPETNGSGSPEIHLRVIGK
jgi:hypothetical protein